MVVPKLVITGGPCTGKSTMVKRLEGLGFPVAHEEAGPLIKSGNPCIKTQWDDFQAELIRRQLAAEERLSAHGLPIWCDRGVFDSVAYCRKKGSAIPPAFKDIVTPRYSIAFLMEPLGVWVDDGIRSEDIQFTNEITPLFEEAYKERGVPVFRVAAMPGTPEESIAARLEFMLSTLERVCGIKPPDKCVV